MSQITKSQPIQTCFRGTDLTNKCERAETLKKYLFVIIRGLLIDCDVHHFIEIDSSNVDIILGVYLKCIYWTHHCNDLWKWNLFDRPSELHNISCLINFNGMLLNSKKEQHDTNKHWNIKITFLIV